MAIIPGNEKVFMVDRRTNTTYGGSAALQAMQQWYTMQDVADSVESLAAQDLQEVLTEGNTATTPVLINVSGPIAVNAIEARSDNGYAIYAESTAEDGVHAISYSKDGLHGTSEFGNGVVGQSANGYGVYAYSTNEDGVNATSINKTAVYAQSVNQNAIAAYSTAGYGLYAESVNEDGVNTKSVTRHGLNTLSVEGDGVYSVSTNGHAVFAQNSGFGSKATMKVENAGFANAIEVTSTTGNCILATTGSSASVGIYINGINNPNNSVTGLTSNVESFASSIIANNNGSGNGINAYSASGTAINAYGSFAGISASCSGFPGSYGVIADTAAKNGGGVWDAYSDSRVKENVNPYTKGLSEILLINPVTYDYNGLGGIKQSTGHIGVIAQEIKEVLPETVSIYSAKLNEEDEEKTDLHIFNGTALTYALINAIKELKAEIDLLKSK